MKSVRFKIFYELFPISTRQYNSIEIGLKRTSDEAIQIITSLTNAYRRIGFTRVSITISY